MENILPRICYVLGGEENPLKIGEVFYFSGIKYVLNQSITGDVFPVTDGAPSAGEIYLLSRMINQPENIIRRPQFSEDEKALMRLYSGIGFNYIARDQNNTIAAYPNHPNHSDDEFSPLRNDDFWILPDKFLPQITWDNSPFDVAAYLESEEKI